MYACELMWTCLVWAKRSTPDSFWVPSHRFNPANGEQKGITQTIYTDSEPPSRLPNSLLPSAKLRSANLPLFTSTLWCDAVRDRTPSSRTPSGRSNHATRGRYRNYTKLPCLSLVKDRIYTVFGLVKYRHYKTKHNNFKC